ncbi:MAG: polysaccharide biosynthesis protein [Clostridia bacterium]|nr:polysaccharide biosynthesis protein [Clostridia bacterium]
MKKTPMFSQYRRFILLGLDLVVALACYLVIGAIIPSDAQGVTFWHQIVPVLLLLGAFFVCFRFSAVNRSVWRYAQAPDYLRCTIATGLSTVLFALLDLLCANLMAHTFSFYLLLGLFIGFCLVFARLVYRVATGGLWHNAIGNRSRTLIVGAGEAAMALVAEARENKKCEFVPVAAVDDDPSKVGRHLAGIPVCGTTRDIREVARTYRVNYIIVAIPSIGNQKRAEILDLCSELGILVRVLPQVSDLPDDHNMRMFKYLREITPDELLGREPVDLKEACVPELLAGRRVLVTGGGGSIGSELCRQIAAMGVGHLAIVDIYENNAYEIEQELRREYGKSISLSVHIGSVREYARLSQIFEEEKPQIVFHAAAHKHVPLMEFSPQEAIKNNVFGTLNTARAADAFGVEKFVLISTDKAVNPTNVMGATKRLCEMVVQTFDRHSKTQFVAVRFGNVLGSNGSVIPLFKKQIAAGGPLTVTHPEVIRYFMTIPEAAQLVLTAAAMAKGGEIFVLDMGNPVKILDLARKMIQLSGLREGKDIDIEFTGLRPGEKLYEELLMSEEGMQKTDNAKIFIGHPINVDPNAFSKAIADLSHLVHGKVQPSRGEVIDLLARVVDTYTPEEH